MRRFRYWLAYRLRLLAFRIEPRPNLLDAQLSDFIAGIDPLITPFMVSRKIERD